MLIYKLKSGLTKAKGFTLIEMMIVVTVLGILITLTAFAQRGWQQNIEQRQVQSDLTVATAAMESARNFSKGYPLGLPSTFKAASGVTLQYIWGSNTRYCLQASSKKLTSVIYFVDSAQGKDAKTGSCPASPAHPDAPSPTVAALSTSSIRVSWPAVTGATGYTVRYGTSSPSTVATCTGSPCDISGLTADTTYQVSVTATNTNGSTTSSMVSAITLVPAPASANVTYTGPSYIKGSDGFYYYRYVVTASGGTCSIGSTEWKIGISPNPPTSTTWSGLTWQSSNIRTIDVSATGIYSPTDVYIFAKPRCISGSNSTEGTAAMTTHGSPDGI